MAYVQGMRKYQKTFLGWVFFALLLCMRTTADTQCGMGYISVVRGNDEACVACGDETELNSSSGLDEQCKTNAGRIYCTASDVNYRCKVCPEGTKTNVSKPSSLSDCICENDTYGPGGGPCVEAVCGNGMLEAGEECDDGNTFNGDGCTGFCKYEDSCKCSSGAEWVCTETPLQKTTCCESLLNPITGKYVCTCAGQESDSPAYVVTANCKKQDINECANMHGGCAENAVCTNKDGTLGQGDFECRCPPGMIGDGTKRCDVYMYETHIVFQIVGLNKSKVKSEELIQAFVDDPTIFPTKNISDISVNVDEYKDGALDRPEGELGTPVNQQRRLLQDTPFGVNLQVIVTSEDQLNMERTTDRVDEEAMANFLVNWYDTAVNIITSPSNVVQTVDRVYGAINTVLTGFNVEGIVYNITSLEWLVTVSYVPDSPNTITSMYVTKSGPVPYGPEVEDSFFISKHPCMTTQSVCCLTDYAKDYNIGKFKEAISSEVGQCDSAMQNRDTLGLFDPAKNDEYLLGTLDGLAFSRVTRLSKNRLQLHINRFALRNDIAVREAFPGGFNMEFFVGMSYYTLLPTNAMATVASQTSIYARATDSVTFATTSEQDYNFVEYITLALFQTKFTVDELVEYRPQYVRMGFVIPETIRQNTKTGLVPLTSIRYAIATNIPDALDRTAWKNPCYSSDGTGLFDNSTSSLRQMYLQANMQQCALQPDFCQNPLGEVLSSGLVQFWFPIGDFAIGDDIINAESRYSLYVYVDVSVVLSDGRKSITKLFAQAEITGLSFTRQCEELSAAQTMADIVEVDMDIGIAGNQEDFESSVTKFRNLLTRTDEEDYLNTALTVRAASAQSALITLAVRGNDDTFNNPSARNFHVEIDDLTTMHFLEPGKYDSMLSLLQAGKAYEMVRQDGTGFLEIQLSPQAIDVCTTETIPGDFTCAVRKNIYRRQVVWDYAVHAMATGVGSSDEQRSVDWLQEYVMGLSEFNENYSREFVRVSRAHHKINDRYNKAWFVNPVFTWNADEFSPAQSVLGTQDRTVLLAIVSLEDENFGFGNGGGFRRRFLLQVTSDGGEVQQSLMRLQDRVEQTVDSLVKSPVQRPMPPIKNDAVVNDYEIARMIGIEKSEWWKGTMQARFTAPVGMSAKQVRDTIQERINRNKGKFMNSTPKFLHLVQFLMKPVAGSRRRLLQNNGEVLDWEGTLNVMFDLVNGRPENSDLTDLQMPFVFAAYRNWLKCALMLADVTTDDKGAPDAECMQETTDDMRGFIDGFFLQTCKDYTAHTNQTHPNATDVEGFCKKILVIMDAPESNPPPTPKPGSAAAEGKVGFRVYLTIVDRLLVPDSLSGFDRERIRDLIAQKFGVQPGDVALGGMKPSSFTPETASRRLLNVGMYWEVYVPEDYIIDSVNTDAVGKQLQEDIARDLGYNVELDLFAVQTISILNSGNEVVASTPTSTTPPPKATPATSESEKNDDGNHHVVLIIVIGSVVGGILLIVLVAWLVHTLCMHTKTTGKDRDTDIEGDTAAAYMHAYHGVPTQAHYFTPYGRW